MLVWWQPPQQRQKWGDSEVLPTGNWGQIFFDLFYVGGAYNLGSLIKNSSHDQPCLLYFCGLGLPIMMMWFDKMYYDARFTTRHNNHADILHRSIGVLQLCCVATALSRIRPVEIMSDACHQLDMFQFSAAMFVNAMLNILKYAEVSWYAIGDPAAKISGQRDVQWRLLPMLFFLAAAAESGYSYFHGLQQQNQGNDGCRSSERPIWYCMLSWITWAAFGYLEQVTLAPEKENVYQVSVPMNVPFVLHRYGEWFMLMFGESIISLLIVDGNNESIHQSIAFYSGVLSVIALAHLHFRNEPHLKHHALFRSRHSNYLYTVLVPVYSSALIAMGVSYKLFLYDFEELAAMRNNNNGADDDDYFNDNHRRLGGGGGGYSAGNDNNSDYYNYKETQKYLEEKEQFAADLFSASIVTVLICNDLMLLLHKGVATIQRKALKMSRTKMGILLCLKYILIALLASFSSFNNDPQVMAVIGLAAIVAQDSLRNAFQNKSLKTMLHSSNNNPDQNVGDAGHNNNDNSVYPFDESHDSDASSQACYDSSLSYSISEDQRRLLNYALAKFEQEQAKAMGRGANETANQGFPTSIQEDVGTGPRTARGETGYTQFVEM